MDSHVSNYNYLHVNKLIILIQNVDILLRKKWQNSALTLLKLSIIIKFNVVITLIVYLFVIVLGIIV